MFYAGIDAHKRTCTITIIDERGQKIKEGTVSTNIEALQNFFLPFKDKITAVVETCLNWPFIYKTLNHFLSDGVKVANAYKLRIIAEAKVKTDQISSFTLAQMLRIGYIPEIQVLSEKQIKMRDLVRSRTYLVRIKTRFKNKIHSLLDRDGQSPLSSRDLFSKSGRRFLKIIPAQNPKSFIIKKYLNHIETLETDVKELEIALRNNLSKQKEIKLLRTIPGIGQTAAFLLFTEIGNIDRFPSPGKLCSYAGLTPRVFASGGHEHRGHISHQGNKHMLWILTECAQVAIRFSPGIRKMFLKIKEKRGGKVAIIAVARRLLEIVFHVLNKKEEYQEIKAFPVISRHASLVTTFIERSYIV